MDAFWVKLKSFLCVFKHFSMELKQNGSVMLHSYLWHWWSKLSSWQMGSCPLRLDKWVCAHWLGGLIGLMLHRREHPWDWSYSWRCWWAFKSPELRHVNGYMPLCMASFPRGIESSEQGLPLLRIVPSLPLHLMWCSHCTVWFMPALLLLCCICSSIFCVD
jgi:hypothetical protein